MSTVRQRVAREEFKETAIVRSRAELRAAIDRLLDVLDDFDDDACEERDLWDINTSMRWCVGLALESAVSAIARALVHDGDEVTKQRVADELEREIRAFFSKKHDDTPAPSHWEAVALHIRTARNIAGFYVSISYGRKRGATRKMLDLVLSESDFALSDVEDVGGTGRTGQSAPHGCVRLARTDAKAPDT